MAGKSEERRSKEEKQSETDRVSIGLQVHKLNFSTTTTDPPIPS